MKEINAIAGLTFKILVGVEIGRFLAGLVTTAGKKVLKAGLEALQKKISVEIEEEDEPEADMDLTKRAPAFR